MLLKPKRRKQPRPLTMPRSAMIEHWGVTLSEYEAYLAGFVMAATGHPISLGEFVATGSFRSLAEGVADAKLLEPPRDPGEVDPCSK